MPATFTQTIDNLAWYAIVAQSPCRDIEVYEDNQAGTQDLKFRAPLSSSPVVTRPAGERVAFKNPGGIKANIVGYVQTASGSITLSQEEN